MGFKRKFTVLNYIVSTKKDLIHYITEINNIDINGMP